MKHLFIGLTISLLISCKNKTTKEQQGKGIVSNLSKTDKIPTLDTIIVLPNLSSSNYNGINLTDSLAKIILYKHFENKGYLLPDMIADADSTSEKICIRFDTLYITDFNHNKYSDATITYWLTPPFSSGHCWQPHKAIIIDTDKGYLITNEEFIPDNFAIDSVITKDHNVTIFGYDYDCGNHEVLRNFRVKIE